jgi:hypothetical protein
MTIKNALEILEGYCEEKIKLKNGLVDPSKSWNSKQDLVSQVARMIADTMKTDIIVLNELIKQIKPNCKHPKNMKDYDGKVWYCMNCNWDLD